LDARVASRGSVSTWPTDPRDFKKLFDASPNGVLVLGWDGRVLAINDAYLEITRYRSEELVGANLLQVASPETRKFAADAIEHARRGQTLQRDFVARTKFGEPLPIRAISIPIGPDADGAAFVMGVDLRDRHAAEERERIRSERLRELYALATAPDSHDAHIDAVLETGCRLLQTQGGVFLSNGNGLRIESSHFPEGGLDEARILEHAQSIYNERGTVSSERWIGSRVVAGSTVHGVLMFFNSEAVDGFDDADRDFMGLLSALLGSSIERRRARQHLRTLAYYDPLTGLPNRLLFQERMRDALLDVGGQQERIAVLSIDLDRFKDINDSLGHLGGDRLLQLVAERLSCVVGDRGVVARTGGDEFAVLYSGFTDIEQIRVAAEQLLRAVDAPYRLDDFEQYMTATAGIAVFPDDARDDQTLIKNADIAMYQAKSQGRNSYYFYTPSLDQPLHARLSKEKALRRALSHEEFIVHYQPIYDLRQDAIVGVEALVRWNHPMRGLLFPGQFIPSAEASGLIVQLDEWVLRTAARQLRAWHDEGHEIYLAVNLSARQFHLPDLGGRLIGAIREYALAPQFLHVEITESVAMSDAKYAAKMVRELKRMGACVSVDDFGTGHSSLSYLRRFEVDHMKIDRSFVSGIGSEENDETIVKTLIAMGHALGLIIVAEGVESVRQLEFLKRHDCDRIQGFYISPAVDSAAAAELLKQYRGTAPSPG